MRHLWYNLKLDYVQRHSLHLLCISKYLWSFEHAFISQMNTGNGMVVKGHKRLIWTPQLQGQPDIAITALCCKPFQCWWKQYDKLLQTLPMSNNNTWLIQAGRITSIPRSILDSRYNEGKVRLNGWPIHALPCSIGLSGKILRQW